MGRDTSGVRGMDVAGKDNEVLAMDVARDDQDLLVVTENGYGKRTPIDEYRKTTRGAKGVKTISSPRPRAGSPARSSCASTRSSSSSPQNGMVQRTGVRGISRYGRTSQGVRVMNIREDDVVSRRRAGRRVRDRATQDSPTATRRCRSTRPAWPTSRRSTATA